MSTPDKSKELKHSDITKDFTKVNFGRRTESSPHLDIGLMTGKPQRQNANETAERRERK